MFGRVKELEKKVDKLESSLQKICPHKEYKLCNFYGYSYMKCVVCDYAVFCDGDKKFKPLKTETVTYKRVK